VQLSDAESLCLAEVQVMAPCHRGCELVRGKNTQIGARAMPFLELPQVVGGPPADFWDFFGEERKKTSECG
jgi:hypothetical protein